MYNGDNHATTYPAVSHLNPNRLSALQQTDYNNGHNNFPPRLIHQINAYDPRVIADTETKRKMLEILQVQRKLFEVEKISNLLQVLDNEHIDLGKQKIMKLPNNMKIEHDPIHRYVPTDLYLIAMEMAKTTNTDILSCVMSLLSTTAIAMRSRYRVKLERYWSEMINLYIMLAKNSGENKSALCEMAKHPHRKFLSHRRKSKTLEDMHLNEMQSTIHDAAKGIKRAVVASYTKKILKSGENSKCIGSMIDKLKSVDNDFLPYVIPNRANEEIFFDVTTSLGLVKKLQSQGETIAMIEPEAGMILSRFFKDKSILPILLKCYGAESYQYDSSTPGRCVNLERPSMNILLMLQNSVMFRLFESDFLMEIGFLPRTLPILGGNFENLFSDNFLFNRLKAKQDWMALYEEKIIGILERTYTQDTERVIFDIPCEPDARSLALDFRHENRRCLEAGQYRHMVPFIRKLHGTAARITGAIHGWSFPQPHEHPITAKEMEAGIALAKICRDHANVAFDTQARGTKKFAIKILKYLLRQDWSRTQPLISASDLQRNISGLNKAKCLPALDFLEQHNFIRQHHEPKYAPLCILHPNLFEVNLDYLTDI